ncbi:hypothetical protein RRG08_060554 [Elysia crispata]|uniref:Granulins domain-containing protein n=1 Tax=Elysia crispata TaxID=231223 RepID=A0AAE1AMK8_9GAST|nr:hypothetical protein RRG08_060554 [Elysia crispata]
MKASHLSRHKLVRLRWVTCTPNHVIRTQKHGQLQSTDSGFPDTKTSLGFGPEKQVHRLNVTKHLRTKFPPVFKSLEQKYSFDKMKIRICITILALVGASSAMNVNRMDIQEEDTSHQKKNVLFFEPQEDQPNLGNATSCKNPKYFCSDNRPCCEKGNGTVPTCCPYPQGVCCPDGIHCCPRQSFCDMVHGRCFRKPSTNGIIGEVFDLALASQANFIVHNLEKPNLSNGTSCKDPKYICSGGRPCCEKPNGQNGTAPSCCPYPQGVCCPDGIHCCPRQSFCDMLHKRCYHKSKLYGLSEEIFDMAVASQEWLKSQVLKKVVEDSLTCPDGTKCPNGQTCCKDNTGAYACCPLPEATCCDDHVHCCPKGHTCDIEKGKCNQGNSSTSLAVKKPSIFAAAEFPTPESYVSENDGIPCPGGEVACPNQYTCCKILSGGYGCCPLPRAVCCADHVHCCPNGYRCDITAGTCSKGDDVIAWVSKQDTIPKQAVIPKKSISKQEPICPDNITCLDGETCCPGEQNSYACCPLPDAVCCSDKLRCCPSGYTCDVAHGKCNMGNFALTWFSKRPAKSLPVVNEVCPDKSTCPSGNTCCKDQQGGYACCPVPQAVCCSDRLHCCPAGYTCDVAAGRCNKGTEFLAIFTKQPSTPALVGSNPVCPDGSSCPSGNTCCKNQQGSYSCCPLPSAVCCSDRLHCCPAGYTCDVAAGRCNKGNEFLAIFTKQPSTPALVGSNTVCPDGSSCPSGNTCCENQQGSYGCCPLPSAVCCSDKLHCCPAGYTCDVSAGRCNKGNDFLAIFTMQPSTPAPVGSNPVCPDGSSCPSGNTCCENQQGTYSCCPLPSAVCCSDRLHCCPTGYTCDVAAGRCNKGTEFLAIFTKQPSTPALVGSNPVCPDGSSCPNGNTCCKNQQGSYSCCPLPSAVCCSDGLHCCPAGYTCDVAAGRCNKGNEFLAIFTKQPSTPALVGSNTVCPDGSSCPSGNTCCENQQGSYGCCPLPSAVCCSDKLHCCPAGYTCDVSAGRCNKGNDFLAIFTKQPSTPAPVVSNTVCPDGSSCPNGNTCCENQQGTYSCCPLPSAVCCSDKLHCCPAGYTCDVSAGSCNKGNEFLAIFTKQPSTPAPVVSNTAVCCSDKLHCCPAGYTCDVSSGRCNKGNEFIAIYSKQPSTPALVGINAVCPDGSSCPSGNTCCKNQQGTYSCCPLPSAVCCSDRLHCCPAGYTCDVSAGRCNKGNDFLAIFTKQPSTPAPVVSNTVCPDGSSCPNGNTCCENQQGTYSCCPLPSEAILYVLMGRPALVEILVVKISKAPIVVVLYQALFAALTDSTAVPPAILVMFLLAGVTKATNLLPFFQSSQLPLHLYEAILSVLMGRPAQVEILVVKISKAAMVVVLYQVCSKGNEFIAIHSKQPSTPALVGSNTVCPDGSSCPSGNTCCENQQGSYGCCPLPSAVCCSDRLHCCPAGYTCDVSAGRCNKGNEFIAIFSKQPATPAPVGSNPVCPDGSSCPSGNTCCENQQGSYGCCPLPSAVCCSDKLHCCPAGYTCDVSSGSCSKGNEFIAIYSKQPSTPALVGSNTVCPDRSSCPSGNTCCENQQGSYSCCPLSSAVCCSDKLHCCPEGYTCDVSAGRCNKGNEFMKLFTKQPSTPASAGNEVVCPDLSTCPSRESCCENQLGGYGCCPLPMAICCPDKVHCCPHGWECDNGRCIGLNAKLTITWFSKSPAKKSSLMQNIICPDHSTCSNGSTCCEVGQGKYGCCPTPNAVCCADKVHYCPQNTASTSHNWSLRVQPVQSNQQKDPVSFHFLNNLYCKVSEESACFIPMLALFQISRG